MAAMITSSKTSKQFIQRIAADYPQFKFAPGPREHWSPKTQTITFSPGEPERQQHFGLLHELAHALLEHTNYHSDFELLKMESQAWALAAELGSKYGIKVDDDHIQNCLDTYRDWLHRRNQCPVCGMHVMQKDPNTYQCFNCGNSWRVSSRRFARSYRRRI